MQELEILQTLDHPNILWLHEIIDSPKKDHLYFVTEFHINGSINDLIKQANAKHNEKNKEYLRKGQFEKCKFKGMKPNICRLFLIDMLRALHYCHEVVKIIHRDIKPDNIMINHNNEAVLIDFGVSALLDDKKDDPSKQTVGTF